MARIEVSLSFTDEDGRPQKEAAQLQIPDDKLSRLRWAFDQSLLLLQEMDVIQIEGRTTVRLPWITNEGATGGEATS